jgi:hypothetical protein
MQNNGQTSKSQSKNDAKMSYPFPVWSGIFEHYDRIGEAIWEFLWCLNRITREENGVGLVLGGAPIKLERIVNEMKGSRKETVRLRLKKLVAESYIRVRRTPYGQVIEVLNSKKFNIWRGGEKPEIRASLPREKPEIRVRETRFARQRNPKSVVSKEDTVVDSVGDTVVVPSVLERERVYGVALTPGGLGKGTPETCPAPQKQKQKLKLVLVDAWGTRLADQGDGDE